MGAVGSLQSVVQEAAGMTYRALLLRAGRDFRDSGGFTGSDG